MSAKFAKDLSTIKAEIPVGVVIKFPKKENVVGDELEGEQLLEEDQDRFEELVASLWERINTGKTDTFVILEISSTDRPKINHMVFQPISVISFIQASQVLRQWIEGLCLNLKAQK